MFVNLISRRNNHFFVSDAITFECHKKASFLPFSQNRFDSNTPVMLFDIASVTVWPKLPVTDRLEIGNFSEVPIAFPAPVYIFPHWFSISYPPLIRGLRDSLKLLPEQDTWRPRDSFKLLQKQNTKGLRNSFRLLTSKTRHKERPGFFKLRASETKHREDQEILSNYFKNQTQGVPSFFQIT